MLSHHQGYNHRGNGLSWRSRVARYTSSWDWLTFSSTASFDLPLLRNRKQGSCRSTASSGQNAAGGGGMTVCRPRLRVLAADCTCWLRRSSRLARAGRGRIHSTPWSWAVTDHPHGKHGESRLWLHSIEIGQCRGTNNMVSSHAFVVQLFNTSTRLVSLRMMTLALTMPNQSKGAATMSSGSETHAQTKWIAEQQLRAAAIAGVVGSVQILRPRLITFSYKGSIRTRYL